MNKQKIKEEVIAIISGTPIEELRKLKKVSPAFYKHLYQKVEETIDTTIEVIQEAECEKTVKKIVRCRCGEELDLTTAKWCEHYPIKTKLCPKGHCICHLLKHKHKWREATDEERKHGFETMLKEKFGGVAETKAKIMKTEKRCKRCGCGVWQMGTGKWFHQFMLQHDNGGCPEDCHFPLGVVPNNMVV